MIRNYQGEIVVWLIVIAIMVCLIATAGYFMFDASIKRKYRNIPVCLLCAIAAAAFAVTAYRNAEAAGADYLTAMNEAVEQCRDAPNILDCLENSGFSLAWKQKK